MMDSAPISRRKLSDEVFDRVLETIKDGTLQPGDLMPSERALMETLGVGRPAVREALQSLARMGLIEIRHGGRARVAEPSFGHMFDQLGETMRHLLIHSPTNLEHLKDARATLEREVARMAAKRRADSDVRRLWGVLDDQAAAVDDTAKFRALDGRFHREIAAISGNPIWPVVSEAVFSWLNNFHVDLVAVPGLEQLTLTEHRQIAEAIEQRDPDAAAQAMGDHLYRANELYRRANLA
ncbi:transcriptional regulator NanR [Acuticoccus sp. MNP-M23]|uniref:transcriptional regulator NanR n=1 Tax=Acuticoccus sp. MNP-M23 TaxID=3072793 RepID=UPI0028158D1E|nr:transcriptional regulator NanR [Acuticoccus sp. MNP-M23]WMS41980.1 transcriptional regulator NanR [Acuticoccus sp. MNP-M23]